MNNTTTIIALITALTGLAMLAFVLPYDEDKKMTTITGTVIAVEHKEKFDLVKIVPTKPISILAFEKTNLNKNDNVTVTGTLQDYNGKIELVANTIT